MRRKIAKAGVFGLFVFLFLYVFQPFQIHFLGESLIIAAAGFGAVTFAVMLVLNGFVPMVFPNYFDEKGWTLGREVFYTLLNVWLIGVFNFLFYNYFFAHTFTVGNFFWFQFTTIAIGLFPVSIITLFRERYSRNHYSREARLLSDGLWKEPTKKPQHQLLMIPSRNKNESFEVDIDELLYFKAADNYIEVHFLEGSLKKKLIRNTLKAMEDELRDRDNFYRCHKSYIVNLNRVSTISGNAQGYTLHFPETDQGAPVSRQNNAAIKDYFSGRH